jgi:hypothetical protein
MLHAHNSDSPQYVAAKVNRDARGSQKRLKLVYVLLYFPYFTETFVADGILALREAGHDVRIVSLLRPLAGPVQPRSANIAAETMYAASLASSRLWRSQLHFLRQSTRTYGRLLFELVTQPLTERPFRTIATRLRIFLKAVQVAGALENEQVHVYHSHFAWLSSAATRICAQLHKRPFAFTAHAYDVTHATRLIAPAADNLRWQSGAEERTSRPHCFVPRSCE